MKNLRNYIRQVLLEEQQKLPPPLPEPIMKAIQNYSRAAADKCGIPREYDYWKDRSMHPHAGQCRGSASGLARAIDDAAGKKVSRMVGGWFRSASDDYYYPSHGWRTYPPSELRKPGENWEEHWWVEVMGWYVDVTANQFFPKDVAKQKAHELVITPADMEKYYPHRRRALNRQQQLSPSLEKLAKRLSTLKKARKWQADQDGPYEAAEWLQKNGPKYGLTNVQVTNIAATLRHEDVAIDFSDIQQVRNLIGEAL
jgi:hypothetical protein